jgi:DUF3102 family protein
VQATVLRRSRALQANGGEVKRQPGKRAGSSRRPERSQASAHLLETWSGDTIRGPRWAPLLKKRDMSQENHEENAPVEADRTVAQGLLDYGGLERSILASLRQHADRIRTAYSDATKRVFEMGLELTLAKRLLSHGQFGPWLKAEFGWSERTAQRYMQAVEMFVPKADMVSVLEPTAIYALSSKSTPAAVREQVVSRLEAGEKPDLGKVQTKVAEARKVERAERAMMRVARDPRQPLPAVTARAQCASGLAVW